MTITGLQVEHWPIDQLVPYVRNARTHSPEQIAQVAASIVEFGWTNPILVGADRVVIAGHARLLAARKLCMAEVPVIVLGHLSEAQRRALVLTDNKLALNAGWEWVVWDDLGPGKRRLLKTTTAEMLPRYKVRGIRNRFAIEVAGPLSTPIADLPVDPYLLGVWLGNGSAAMSHITVHESDEEFSELLADCGFDVQFRLPWWRKGRAANILVDPGRRPSRDEIGRFAAVKDREAPSFMACLRDLGVFQNKHIPRSYLRASISQRLALLQGLMDTDGHCTKLGRCEFSTSSERILKGAYELIVSLGMKATVYVSDRAAGFRKYPKRHYRISFLAYSDLPIFRLRRKLQRQKPIDETCRWTETVRRRVESIDPTESVPVRCIEVDSESHLYLAGRSMVPTHNTECGNNWIGYVVH